MSLSTDELFRSADHRWCDEVEEAPASFVQVCMYRAHDRSSVRNSYPVQYGTSNKVESTITKYKVAHEQVRSIDNDAASGDFRYRAESVGHPGAAGAPRNCIGELARR